VIDLASHATEEKRILKCPKTKLDDLALAMPGEAAGRRAFLANLPEFRLPLPTPLPAWFGWHQQGGASEQAQMKDAKDGLGGRRHTDFASSEGISRSKSG